MSPAPDRDTDALRRLLNERAAALRLELRTDRAKLAANVSDAHMVLDRKDQAGFQIQAGVDDAELERDLDELTAVEAALQRLDSGHFGRCITCAEPIAAERLAAQPWAMRCLQCQTRFEQRAARGAG